MKGSQKAPLSLTDKTDKSLSQALKLTPDGSLLRRAHLAVVPDLSDPEDIQAWLLERAAMREDSGIVRVDFPRLQFFFDLLHPVEVVIRAGLARARSSP